MSYFDWLDKKTRPKRAQREAEQDELDAVETAARPSEPIQVQEDHASTTVIERLFSVIGKRR